MGKKFSIIKEIDLNKLGKKIDDYRHETGECNPYIFANGETIFAIKDECFKNIDPFNGYFVKDNPCGKVGRYEGYRMFQNDDLGFGEIELR